MKKRLGIVIAVLMGLMMIFSITGCGQQGDDETFEGSLVNARSNVLVVRDSTAYVRQFYTNDKTVFSYESGSSMKVGDSLQISYHQEGSKYIATEVAVLDPKEDTLTLVGEVTELTGSTLTVNANSLTVEFSYDKKTSIEGELSKGDTVRVVYYGDISEDPYASEIVVEEEKAEAALHKISGIVSEISGKSMLLSVDSADAFRFKVTNDTIIDGKADNVEVGDHVTVVYSGNLKKDPKLHRIEVTRTAEQDLMVIDGHIDKVTADKIVLNTGVKSYTFKVTEGTQYSGSVAAEKGVKATITYKGKLKKKPVAVSVYCEKAKEKKKETKTTKKTKATKETKATKATKETGFTDPSDITDPTEETDEPPTEETEEPPTEETEEPPTEETEPPTEETEPPTEETEPPTEETEPPTEETEPPTEAPAEPEDVSIKAKGVILVWGDSCTIRQNDGSKLELDPSGTTISSGYFPEEGDTVQITYNLDTMELLDIQLVSRPD